MAPSFDHIVYRLSDITALQEPPHVEGYEFSLWTPSPIRHLPPSAPRKTYSVWWLFHATRVFFNRNYCVVVARRQDVIAHRLGVFPGYFRFPFMSRDDLQIGDVWTDPQHRGRGLAPQGIACAVERCAKPGRTFWYLTHEDNRASIRAVERVGFTRVGVATRRRRLGVRALGMFDFRAT